jgi:RNA polymerase sigma-70 factor (ECF subfamily)
VTDAVDFEDFYQGTRHRVATFLYALTGDRGEAQDAAQEAYARAWQNWSRVGSYEDPEAWVRMVGYRLAMNVWRKAANRFRAYRRHGTAHDVDPPGETTLMVRAALRDLPHEQRLVVVLHYVLDLPVAEISRQTGVPANTVKTRLARGRRRLATLMNLDLAEEETRA